MKPRKSNPVRGVKACEQCGEDFEYKLETAKYCSNKCRCKSHWPKLRMKPRDQHQRLIYSIKSRDPECILVKEDLDELYDSQNGLCSLTGFPLTNVTHMGKSCITHNLKNTSVDRIDQSKGYTKDNIRLVCYQANMMRGVLSDEGLALWCQAILTNANKEVARKKREAKK